MNNLEDDLRRVLNDPHRAPRTWPDATERVRAGMRRRHQRRIVTAAASLTLVVAVAVALTVSLGHPKSAPPAHPSPSRSGVVPYLDLPYSPLPIVRNSPRPPATPCTVADLSLINMETDGALGTEHHIVSVRNNSHSRCTLSGRPALYQVKPNTQQPVLAKTDAVDNTPEDPNSVPATIDPGENALLDIVTTGGCNDGTRPVVTYHDVSVAVSGGLFPLHTNFDATCGVGVGLWQRPAPAQTLVTDLPMQVAIIAPTRTVRIGGTLDFVVELRNLSNHDIPLDPCPDYEILLDTVKAPGLKQLNCAVPSIPVGRAVQFAMRVTIPDSTQYTGDTTLTWYLGDPSVSYPPNANITITITK